MEEYRHIKDGDRLACSGARAWKHIWAFEDLEHAERSIDNGSYVNPCPLCMSKISDVPITVYLPAERISSDDGRVFPEDRDAIDDPHGYMERCMVSHGDIERDGAYWVVKNCHFPSGCIIPPGCEITYG